MKKNIYSFCNVCSNKTYNEEQILICNKTGRIPDFGFTCNNYHLDEAEYKNVENKLLLEIEKNVRRPDFIVEINVKTELSEYEKCQDYMKLPENMIFKKESYTFLLLVAIGLIFYIPSFIEEQVSLGFLLLIIPITIISVWIQKRLDYDEYNTLILSKDGIQFNQLEYRWDDIMTTHIKRYNYRRLNNKSFDKFLILGMKSGKIVKSLDLEGMRLSSRWYKLFSYPISNILGHYVELYKKGFNNNWSRK
jgi:hypothetical protein